MASLQVYNLKSINLSFYVQASLNDAIEIGILKDQRKLKFSGDTIKKIMLDVNTDGKYRKIGKDTKSCQNGDE